MSGEPHEATELALVVCKTCRIGTLSPAPMQTASTVLHVLWGFPCTVCGSWQTCPVSPDGVHVFLTAAGVPEVDVYAPQQPVVGCLHCGTRYAFEPVARRVH